jgi:hypothetical protein
MRHNFPHSQRLKKQRGFTIVEILIYMGLLSIFAITTGEIFLSLLESKVESLATSSIEQDSTYVTNKLAYDVSRASSITTPSSLGGSGSVLSLVIGGVTYTYSLSGTTLQLTSNAGTEQLTTANTQVTGITFQRLGNASGKDTVRIQMNMQSTAQQNAGKETRVVTATAGRRQ